MKPLLVLGMLRSGTSATTRALGLLGASMGPEADMGMFWENQPMRRVNRDLLGALRRRLGVPAGAPRGLGQLARGAGARPAGEGASSRRSSATHR